MYKKQHDNLKPSNKFIETINANAYLAFQHDIKRFNLKAKKIDPNVFSEDHSPTLAKLLAFHTRETLVYIAFICLDLKLKKSLPEITESPDSAAEIINIVYRISEKKITLTIEEINELLKDLVPKDEDEPILKDVMPDRIYDNSAVTDFAEDLSSSPSPDAEISFSEFLYSIFQDETTINNDLEKFIEINNQNLNNYFIGRYFLTDAIKAAAYTPFYIGIHSLTGEQKSQLRQASKISKNSGVLFYDYYNKVFGLKGDALEKNDILDMTFGNKGIRGRMKNFFSLKPVDHINDPEADTNCIRLAAYLKGMEFKYGKTLNNTVKKTSKFNLILFFRDYLEGNERHPKLAQIYDEIISCMINDVQSCCDIDFVLICEEANDAIDNALASVFPFGTTVDGNATMYVRTYMPDSAMPDIKQIIDDNDKAAEGSYNVWEEFYMFLLALKRRAYFAKQLDMCSFDDIIQNLCARRERLATGHLTRIGVRFTKSNEEYKKMYTTKKEALKTAPADPADEYFKDSIMVRALDHYIDFGDFISRYRDSLVDFLCDDTDINAKKRFRRKIKDNLGNIIYLIKYIYGKNVNALDVFLCFYLYFSLHGINIRRNGYQSHDKKTLISIINSGELSLDDANVLRIVLQKMKSIVMIGNDSTDQEVHSVEALILSYFSEQIEHQSFITASQNIASLMKRIDEYRLMH